MEHCSSFLQMHFGGYMKFVLPLMIPVLLLLAACGAGSSTKPTGEHFSCDVTLTDNNGEPLQGYEVMIASVPCTGMGRAEANICFTIPEPTETVRVYVTDSRDQQVKLLVSEAMECGVHQIVWRGNDDEDAPVSPGLYLAHTELINNNTVTDSDTAAMYYLDFNPELDGPTTTNAQGEASFNAIELAPGLYRHDEIVLTDEQDVTLGEMALSDTTWIYVTDPSGQGDCFRSIKVNMTDGYNAFDIVWDEMDSDATSTGSGAPKGVEDGEIDPWDEINLSVFPNPFN